jgi:type IV pilus assembly protein PilB
MNTRFGVTYIDPSVMVIPRAAVESIPAELARGENVAPISLAGGTLTVAVENPLDFELLDKLRYHCGMPIAVVAADADRIRAVVGWHYGEDKVA